MPAPVSGNRHRVFDTLLNLKNLLFLLLYGCVKGVFTLPFQELLLQYR